MYVDKRVVFGGDIWYKLSKSSYAYLNFWREDYLYVSLYLSLKKCLEKHKRKGTRVFNLETRYLPRSILWLVLPRFFPGRSALQPNF